VITDLPHAFGAPNRPKDAMHARNAGFFHQRCMLPDRAFHSFDHLICLYDIIILLDAGATAKRSPTCWRHKAQA